MKYISKILSILIVIHQSIVLTYKITKSENNTKINIGTINENNDKKTKKIFTKSVTNYSQYDENNIIPTLSFYKDSYDYFSAFQCMDIKEHECRLYCVQQDADEAECEDPWPPAGSLSCYCYKRYKLIDGKVLHLNLTEDFYMDPEKLAIALT
ncbi:uncharacterized protein LOC142330473 isoform X2 [Lycorma delicatula]|uniref:uncharacterized protein LOC142330473 isoform X2 n=1 Tax=Lycorma delicatula TaxID=130591 RepID=UPI003F518340